MRFENVGLRVTELRRSLRFYTRALGLREVRRGDTRSWGGGIWVLLEDPRSRRKLELNWYPERSLFGGRYLSGDAVDHLDFTLGVAPRKELERVYRHLLKNGAKPTGYEPSTTEGWMASVTDPDGIWITIGRRPTPSERREAVGDSAPRFAILMNRSLPPGDMPAQPACACCSCSSCCRCCACCSVEEACCSTCQPIRSSGTR